MKKLIILTLTWNAKLKLQVLYSSIIPALEGIDWSWNIKDNGSIDQTIEMVKSWNDERILIFNYKNNLQNYSQGNNWLLERCNADDSDYILLLNNDIIFQDNNSIKNMMEILEKDREVGIVGAKLNYENNPKLIQHKGVLFHPMSGMPYHYGASKIETEQDIKNRYYPIITGAVMMIRASTFNKVWGLDESYNWSWEDSDLCMKVCELGEKVVYCGETNILHSESATLKKNPVNKMYFQQNIKIFMNKWGNKIDKSLVQKYDENSNYMLYDM